MTSLVFVFIIEERLSFLLWKKSQNINIYDWSIYLVRLKAWSSWPSKPMYLRYLKHFLWSVLVNKLNNNKFYHWIWIIEVYCQREIQESIETQISSSRVSVLTSLSMLVQGMPWKIESKWGEANKLLILLFIGSKISKICDIFSTGWFFENWLNNRLIKFNAFPDNSTDWVWFLSKTKLM